MSTPYDKDKPGGNSSFGNPHRPPDIQGDDPGKQAEPHDPARPDPAKAPPSGAPPRPGRDS
ncbi:hypothetical protein [Kaistia sp. MMO-174]|uniref:hypothetical protein n=1 Tax=Kaistia sp. MMO-174 TaxID=3081256 RepID=UPI003018CF8A